jgi:hypothetical protein
LRLRLSVSQPITNRLHYSHSDFNKTTKQKIGPAADTVIVTSSGITAREPQQNPVLVFSITLTQKRVRPPVWIILVLHAELASVRAQFGPSCQRPLSLQPPIHSRTCVRCTFPVACTHTIKNQKMQMQILTDTHRRRAHARTHTRKHQHRKTCTRHLQSLDDDVLRHILQHHIWVCLIIPDNIERSHLSCFTCSTLFLRLYWNRIWQRGRGPLL